MEIGEAPRLIAGVPLIVLVPALVELAKRNGLRAGQAGFASIAIATVLLALADLSFGGDIDHSWMATIAGWLVGGVVYGLAGSGLYSQREQLPLSAIGTSRGDHT